MNNGDNDEDLKPRALHGRVEVPDIIKRKKLHVSPASLAKKKNAPLRPGDQWGAYGEEWGREESGLTFH